MNITVIDFIDCNHFILLFFLYYNFNWFLPILMILMILANYSIEYIIIVFLPQYSLYFFDACIVELSIVEKINK